MDAPAVDTNLVVLDVATRWRIDAALFLIAAAGFLGWSVTEGHASRALVAFVVEVVVGVLLERWTSLLPSATRLAGADRLPAGAQTGSPFRYAVVGAGRVLLRRQRRDRLLPRRRELRRRVLRCVRGHPPHRRRPRPPRRAPRPGRAAGQRRPAPARLLRHVARALGRIRRMIRASAASRGLSPHRHGVTRSWIGRPRIVPSTSTTAGETGQLQATPWRGARVR
jgi:hypothetical protein